MPEPDLRYKRILLKLSGEALMGNREFGLDMPTVREVAGQIKCRADARRQTRPVAHIQPREVP